jgi:alpha-tubulin suppressor-like RCC1 family protein
MELGFRSVSLGRFHTCAVRGNDLTCWGSNELGELGLGDMLRRNTPTLLSF